MYSVAVSIHEEIIGAAITSEEDKPYAYNFQANVSRQRVQYNYTEEYEPLYEVPTSMIVILSCLYGSISVLAVVGNFLVMWVVGTSRRMQSVTNCYIANLALADIVIGLFAVPFQFQAALLQRWLLPHFMCPFCPFVQALSVNVSVFTLTAIAVDRHRAIITPLSANTSRRVAKIVVVLIWVLAVALAAPMGMSWEVVMEDEIDKETKLRFKKPFCAASNFGQHSLHIYRLSLFLFQYLTPLCIITCAYTHMAFKLWITRAPGNAQELRDAAHMKNKKRVIKMFIIVVLLFAICWMPLQTYYLLQTYFPAINEYKYINIVFFCFDWLAMSNSCYNPFIYGIYNVKFQEEFKQKNPFRKKRSKFNDNYENEKSNSAPTRIYSSIKSSNECKRCSCSTSFTNVMSHSRRTSVRYESGHTHTTYTAETGGNAHVNSDRTTYGNTSLAAMPHLRENRFVVAYNERRNSDRFYTRTPEPFIHLLDLEETTTERYLLSNPEGSVIKNVCRGRKL